MACVLIVDDNPTIRRIICEHLKTAGVEVCAEAADGLEAIEKSPELNPDLVILDVAMPRLNGIDAARQLRKLHPDIPIILHTQHADVIRSQGLPEGVTEVMMKGESLMPRVMALLPYL